MRRPYREKYQLTVSNAVFLFFVFEINKKELFTMCLQFSTICEVPQERSLGNPQQPVFSTIVMSKPSLVSSLQQKLLTQKSRRFSRLDRRFLVQYKSPKRHRCTPGAPTCETSCISAGCFRTAICYLSEIRTIGHGGVYLELFPVPVNRSGSNRLPCLEMSDT